MTPGGADGQRGNQKGRGTALPSDYVPPGCVRTNMRDANTLGGSLPGSPALNASASGQPLDADSLKAEVEAIRLRLTAQRATNRSLAEAHDERIANVEAMRQEDIESDARAPKSRRVARRRERLRSSLTPRGASRLPLVQSQLAKLPNIGIKSVSFARSCVRSARRPSWPARHPQLRTPTCRPRMSQARPVGQLPLRPPTLENPRAPRRPRRRAPAPSLRTRHRTPRLDDPARVRTRVAPTLRSGWRKPFC